MIRFSPLAVVLCLLGSAPAGAAEQLRVAAWSIADLWHEPGKALRHVGASQPAGRGAADYAALKRTGATLDADVIALHSVGSPQAVRRVFAAADYHLVFSKSLHRRFAADRRAFYDPARRGAYSAVVVRRERAVRVIGVEAITDRRGGQAAGLGVELIVKGKRLFLLAVDLAEGCGGGRTGDDAHPCTTLAAQASAIGAWIEARRRTKARFVIAATLAVGLVTRDGDLFAMLDQEGGEPADGAQSPNKKWSPTPWSAVDWAAAERRQLALKEVGLQKLRSREAKARASREAATRAVPARSGDENLLDIVVDAFRAYLSAPRQQKTLPDEVEAPSDVDVAIEPSPASDMTTAAAAAAPPEATATGVAAPAGEAIAVGTRLARYPDTGAGDPCHPDVATAAGETVPPARDFMLLDRSLGADETMLGFGAVAEGRDGNADSGSASCPIFVDLKL